MALGADTMRVCMPAALAPALAVVQPKLDTRKFVRPWVPK